MDESYSTEAIKYRTHNLEDRLQDSSEDSSKLFYLQQTDCSVPNSSESFQSRVPSSVVRNGESSSSSSSSNSASWGKAASKVADVVAAKRKADFISSNGTNRSNCSSSDMQQCNWLDCEICLEGNTELVEHIRTQHVQVQKDKESFVCLWAGCKVGDFTILINLLYE